MRKSMLKKVIPVVLLGAVSGGSSYGMENAGGVNGFSAEDIKALMASSRPLKERKVAHINQETDVITFYASTDSDDEPPVNDEKQKKTWTWGQGIPVSETIRAEILARGPQLCVKFDIMSEAEFSGTDKPEPFTWFGKEWKPSADLKEKFKSPQLEQVITGIQLTPSGGSGSTISNHAPNGFGGDPHQ